MSKSNYLFQRQQMTMPQIEAPPPVRKGESEKSPRKLYLSDT